MDEAVRFAKTWQELSAKLHEPLLDVTTVKGDDSYGDLLDSLPLAGRNVVDCCLPTDNHRDDGDVLCYVFDLQGLTAVTS